MNPILNLQNIFKAIQYLSQLVELNETFNIIKVN